MGLQINYIRIIFAAYLRRQDQKSENHIFFSALKCHCYPEPHQDGAGIRGYQRFASTTEISCVERIIICLTDPPHPALDIFL